jgi:hypothetical protein
MNRPHVHGTPYRDRRNGWLALALAGAIGFSAAAEAQEKFVPPDMAGFRPHKEGVFDFDAGRDGEIDTFGRDYRNPFGDRIIQFSALSDRGGMWGIFVDQSDTKDGTTMLDGDYLLIDTNCDGAFDQKVALETELVLPECFLK